MKRRESVATILFITAIAMNAPRLHAQADPGPRPGPASAGGYFPALNANEQSMYAQAMLRFLEVDSVSGKLSGEPGIGLGPTFNGNSCAMCHAQPAAGGSSPGLASPQKPIQNPQIDLANLDGAANAIPAFITPNGPVREARFVQNSNRTLDGGVHGLYTISGREDAVGCSLQQPDFATALAQNNVIFRIPTPLFGLGLIEATPDANLRANLASTQGARMALRIGGAFNTSGNDGTITRFGWKAQNKSVLIFSGEAYNVEQGVSNEAFPNERSAVAGCVFNNSPEDATNFLNNNVNSPNYGTSVGTALEMASDIVNFGMLASLLAPPSPAAPTPSSQNGSRLFSAIGCALCHSPTLTTGPSLFTGMSNIAYNPYSDFALHHMGSKLADGISQGAAGPDQFRTAPLWGIGQRLFFLHDGRTSDLLEAIREHADCATGGNQGSRSPDHTQQWSSAGTCGSESNGAIDNFNKLSGSQQQDILNFLRSL